MVNILARTAGALTAVMVSGCASTGANRLSAVPLAEAVQPPASMSSWEKVRDPKQAMLAREPRLKLDASSAPKQVSLMPGRVTLTLRRRTVPMLATVTMNSTVVPAQSSSDSRKWQQQQHKEMHQRMAGKPACCNYTPHCSQIRCITLHLLQQG